MLQLIFRDMMSKVEANKFPALYYAGGAQRPASCQATNHYHWGIFPTPTFLFSTLMCKLSSNMNSTIVSDETADILIQSMEEIPTHDCLPIKVYCPPLPQMI